jgi:hypothetical protein
VNFSIQIGVPARRTRACACQAVDGVLVAQVVDAEDERPATAPQLTAISSSCSCADLEQKLRWREQGREVEDDRIFAGMVYYDSPPPARERVSRLPFPRGHEVYGVDFLVGLCQRPRLLAVERSLASASISRDVTILPVFAYASWFRSTSARR